MTAALVDATTFSDVAPGDGVVTVTLPTNGARDLVVVAIALPDGSVVPDRRPPFAAGSVGPAADVPGWTTVISAAPLVVLAAHGPNAATLDVPVRGDGGTIEAIAASFSGASEAQGSTTSTTATVALIGSVTASIPTDSLDGFVFAAFAADRSPSWPLEGAGDLTVIDTGSSIIAAWGTVAAFASASWSWSWQFSGGRSAEVALGAVRVADAYNDLVTLTSASYQPAVLAAAPAPGDPPAVFSELVWRSDGVAPEPLPVETPTRPWWTP